MKKSYYAILFDLDGTLLDTLYDIGNAMNHVLAVAGLPVHSLDDYRYFVGDGAAELVRRTLPENKRGEAEIQQYLEAFKKYYGQHWQALTRPYEGIPEMLDALTRSGMKMAILSNKPHDFTRMCVDELLSDWRFDAVFGLRESVPRKPHPAGALEIAECLDLAPTEFLYLGDTAIDMKTAQAAGMFPLGALWGFRSREELIGSGAEAVIHHPLEIIELLGLPPANGFGR